MILVKRCKVSGCTIHYVEQILNELLIVDSNHTQDWTTVSKFARLSVLDVEDQILIVADIEMRM
jgi:hypothetical protein